MLHQYNLYIAGYKLNFKTMPVIITYRGNVISSGQQYYIDNKKSTLIDIWQMRYESTYSLQEIDIIFQSL